MKIVIDAGGRRVEIEAPDDKRVGDVAKQTRDLWEGTAATTGTGAGPAIGFTAQIAGNRPLLWHELSKDTQCEEESA